MVGDITADLTAVIHGIKYDKTYDLTVQARYESSHISFVFIDQWSYDKAHLAVRGYFVLQPFVAYLFERLKLRACEGLYLFDDDAIFAGAVPRISQLLLLVAYQVKLWNVNDSLDTELVYGIAHIAECLSRSMIDVQENRIALKLDEI